MQDSLHKILYRFKASWKKAPKWQRIFIVTVIALFAFKTAFGWFSNSISELKSVNNSLRDKRRLAKVMEIESQRLVDFEYELQAAETRLDSLTKTLLDYADPTSFLLESAGIEYFLITPKSLIDHGLYKEYPFCFRFAAKFSDMVAYLKYLENMEIPLVIQEIKMRPYSRNPQKLHVSMILSSFLSAHADVASISEKDFPVGSDSDWESEPDTDQKFSMLLSDRQSKSKTNLTPKVQKQPSQNVWTKTTSSDPSTAGLKITGFWSGARPKVAINGKFFIVGEKIQGWTIVNINADERTAMISKNRIRKTLTQ